VTVPKEYADEWSRSGRLFQTFAIECEKE